MEFKSFEEALHVCMHAPDQSEEQNAALAYCLEHAPPELKKLLRQRQAQAAHGHDCGCGCNQEIE